MEPRRLKIHMNYVLVSQSIENCSTTTEIYASNPLRLVQFVQIFICLISVGTFWYINVMKRNEKLVPIHRNLKAIYFVTAFICLIQALSVITVHLLHEFRRHFNPAFPCQKQWVAWNCLMVRAPIFISFTSYTLLHIGITVERLAATLTVRRYEQTSGKLAAVILTCIGLTLSSIPTLGSLSTIINILTFVNIPIVCIDLALFTINGQQLDRAKRNPINTYHLSVIYQLRENVISLNITVPFVICHFFTEALYLICNTLVRNFVAQTQLDFLIFAEVTYTLMCSYTFLAIYVPYHYRKKRSRYIIPTSVAVEATMAHFKSLNEQFNRAYSMRRVRSLSNVV